MCSGVLADIYNCHIMMWMQTHFGAIAGNKSLVPEGLTAHQLISGAQG